MTPDSLESSDPAGAAQGASRVQFHPLPLLGNPNVQTLLGHFLPGPAIVLPTREQILRLPDGDSLVLYDNCASRLAGRRTNRGAGSWLVRFT